jgi:putative surface cell wall-binding protein
MKSYRIIGGAALACVLVGALAAPAFADNNGSQATANAAVTAGDRAATLAGSVTFPAVPASHSNQAATAQNTSVEVNDLSGTDAGWNVSIVASALALNGGSATIPAGDVSLAGFGALASISGATTGITPGSVASIGSAVALLSAPAGDGVGDYTQAFSLGLTVPADTPAGAYSGTLTVTVAPPS